ncbi:hypothetical protein GCM10010171_60770 [Actinokineospora fastidiosa]|uniref:Uncharacterized protein n=1 Tax=Actinokineospora fastidiosa TaxID=1816 RepID=A0A918GRS3_9PSEU|nr:hypothetical protein GCM10010171_60770 [Actinokineospora fastidiosa]
MNQLALSAAYPPKQGLPAIPETSPSGEDALKPRATPGTGEPTPHTSQAERGRPRDRRDGPFQRPTTTQAAAGRASDIHELIRRAAAILAHAVSSISAPSPG